MRKIGIVTEGESEVRALPRLYPDLEKRAHAQLIRPVLAAVDPLSPVPVLVGGLRTGIRLSFARGAHLVVVLLDRENYAASAAVRAKEVENKLRSVIDDAIRVVVKDHCLENWLIASPEAFAGQKARYAHPERIARAVTPNRADAVAHPCELIDSAMAKGQYDKTNDAPKIFGMSNLDTLAANSRSFRRFLAVIGDPAYSACSKKP